MRKKCIIYKKNNVLYAKYSVKLLMFTWEKTLTKRLNEPIVFIDISTAYDYLSKRFKKIVLESEIS